METGWINSDDSELLNSVMRHEGTKEVIYARIRSGRLPVAPGCDAEACMATGLWPVYLDSKGYPTNGVGHLITGNEHYDPYAGITDQQAMQQLAEELQEHMLNAQSIAEMKGMEPAIDGNYVVQRFMTELCFNIGKAGYLNFRNGLKKLASAVNGDGNYSYNNAADEHLDSKWHKDVGSRAIEMCNTLRELDG